MLAKSRIEVFPKPEWSLGQVDIIPLTHNKVHGYVESMLDIVGKSGIRIVEKGQ